MGRARPKYKDGTPMDDKVFATNKGAFSVHDAVGPITRLWTL